MSSENVKAAAVKKSQDRPPSTIIPTRQTPDAVMISPESVTDDVDMFALNHAETLQAELENIQGLA